MKESEKWFWNGYKPHDNSYDMDSQLKVKAGWKAAFKRIQEELQVILENEEDWERILSFIKKELEEK